MRQSIKRIAALFVVFATVFSVFAAPKKSTIKEDDNKIIVVGRVKVVFDENREFIKQTRGISDKDAEGKEDTYIVPYCVDTADKLGANQSKFLKDNQTEYPIGDFFIVQFKKLKNSNKLVYTNYMSMYFYGSYKAKIYLPFDFYVEVPDDVNAVYLGTFTYYVTGDNFTIHDWVVSDEYDLAEEELNRLVGEHVDLYRAQLKERETESLFKTKDEK